MRQPGAAVRIWIRIGQAAALAALALSLAACPCPAPVTLDQVFLLDATNGPDAGPAGDASFPPPQPLDCTPAAAGCVPGGACRPACDCIVARDQIRSVASIQSCTLLADSGPAAVEMRYKQEVFCGGD